MSTSNNCILALALILCTACSTTQLALKPIESPRELPLTYRTCWEAGALDATDASDEIVADGVAARVHVSFVHLSTAESESLFGPIGARPAALEVSLADAERVLDAIQVQSSERVVDSGVVAVSADKPGTVRVARQCAYIAAFELSQTPGMAIADPIVKVLEDGYYLRLAARGASDAAATEIAIEFVLSDLEQPMREHVIRLPGSAIPVTVQEPECMTQRIQTNATLSDSRALLLAGIPAKEDGQTMLVVLRSEKR
jgi:hypothetical protein